MRRATGAFAFVAAIIVGEILGRSVPRRERWLEELHPLLGAAPRDSFARAFEADPWRDFAGHVFRREIEPGETRVLLVGGAFARERADAIEKRLAPAKLVVAAREDFGVAQESILVARFAKALGVTRVIAIDGEELDSPRALVGWTSEWTWEKAALSEPLGEAIARHVGLARCLLVREPRGPSLEVEHARYVRGLRSLAVLCEARGLELRWAPVGRAIGDRDAAKAIEGRGRAFDAANNLVESLKK